MNKVFEYLIIIGILIVTLVAAKAFIIQIRGSIKTLPELAI